MRILLIHTCGVEGSIAAADSRENPPVLASAVLPPRTFSEGLMPAIRSVLSQAVWSVSDLEAIGVVNGPGSFTGIRTGLSAGKGLCEARRIPLVGVSRLALMAHSGCPSVSGDSIHTVLDAGRGEFYYGLYRGGLREREALVSRDELIHLTKGASTILVCEEKVTNELAGLPITRLTEPPAGDALPLVLAALRSGADDVLGDANYLRRTDGQIFARTAK